MLLLWAISSKELHSRFRNGLNVIEGAVMVGGDCGIVTVHSRSGISKLDPVGPIQLPPVVSLTKV